MGSAMFGYDSAFIGGALTLPSFQKRFGLESAHGTKLANLKENIVSTFQAGAFFGAILVYLVTEKLGRRLTLLLCGLLFNLGAIAQLASTGHIGAIYAGRVLTGLAVGASSLIIPVYISESSPPAIRGRLVGLFECFLQLFSVIGFWMNFGVSLHVPEVLDMQWQIPFGFQILPATLLIILMFFQPESPRWLIKDGKADEARQNLSRLRKLPLDHEYISWEIKTAQLQTEVENSSRANRAIWAKVKQAFAPPRESAASTYRYGPDATPEHVRYQRTELLLARYLCGYRSQRDQRLAARHRRLRPRQSNHNTDFHFSSHRSPRTTSSNADWVMWRDRRHVLFGRLHGSVTFVYIQKRSEGWRCLYCDPHGLSICHVLCAVLEWRTLGILLRGLPHRHSHRLSGFHYMFPVACPIHHRLLNPLHDDQHHLRDLSAIWYLAYHRHLVHLPTSARNKRPFVGGNGHSFQSEGFRCHQKTRDR